MQAGDSFSRIKRRGAASYAMRGQGTLSGFGNRCPGQRMWQRFKCRVVLESEMSPFVGFDKNKNPGSLCGGCFVERKPVRVDEACGMALPTGHRSDVISLPSHQRSRQQISARIDVSGRKCVIVRKHGGGVAAGKKLMRRLAAHSDLLPNFGDDFNLIKRDATETPNEDIA
jgi:hypothetical protein